MSSSTKLTLAAIGLLIAISAAYYGLQGDPSDVSAQVKLPDPDEPGAAADPLGPDRRDPALTRDDADAAGDLSALIARSRSRRVVSVSEAEHDAGPSPRVDLLDEPTSIEAPAQTDGPTTPTPAAAAPRADAEAPVELPIIDDGQPVDEVADEQPTDTGEADVTPVPADVLVQQTDVPPRQPLDPDIGPGDEGDEAQPEDDLPAGGGDGRTYTVVEGDSMWIIAKKTLGAGHRWQRIAKANPLVDPNRIRPGDELRIPDSEGAAATEADTDDAGAIPQPRRVAEPTREDPLGLGLNRDVRQITVLEGDSLWVIAKREYGDGTRWRILWDANRDRMKDKDDLRPGQKLIVPPLPDED